MLIISSGTVKHQLDFEEHTLSVGDCLVISPGQVHAFNPEWVYKGYMILFTEEFLQNYISHSALAKISKLYKCHLSLSHYHLPNIMQLVQAIEQELNADNEFAQTDFIAAHLTIYLLRLEQLNNLHTSALLSSGKSYELFYAFNRKVEQNYHKNRNAKYYASELAISYKRLNEVCKEFTRKTAKAIIDETITLEIKRLLSATSKSIKEISFQCGFDEPTNFQKYFKKITGETPAQFRMRYL